MPDLHYSLQSPYHSIIRPKLDAYHSIIMVKHEKPEPIANKGHKTLRDKLRKKREEQKKHKKEKSEKHKQYDSETKREQFFGQRNSQPTTAELPVRKVRKHIQKFINVYEDDLEDFFGLFRTLDQKGFIDISGVENKPLQKCLKKLFKYLPLQKQKREYRKNQSCAFRLEDKMRSSVAESIEHYLAHGTEQEDSEQSSGGEQASRAPVCLPKPKQVEEEEEIAPIRLYKPQIELAKVESEMGPALPPEGRQKILALFEQQLRQMKEEKNKEEEDQFGRIFSLGKTKRQLNQPIIQQLPPELLATGSAQLGARAQIDEEQINEYNRTYRSQKLVDQHKEMMGMKKGQQNVKERKPFDRERDVVNGGGIMRNSTFFDFKNRMTKPKTSSSFL